jgi:hypothetical protein
MSLFIAQHNQQIKSTMQKQTYNFKNIDIWNFPKQTQLILFAVISKWSYVHHAREVWATNLIILEQICNLKLNLFVRSQNFSDCKHSAADKQGLI